MDKPIYTNLENPGKSVVDVVVPPVVQFFFRNLIDPKTKKRLNLSKLNQLRCLIWDITANQPATPAGKNKTQTGIALKTKEGPVISRVKVIDASELAQEHWVKTEQVRIPVGHKVGLYLNTEVDDKKTRLYEFEVKRNTIVLITEAQDKDVPHYSKITEEELDAKNILIKGNLTAQAWLDSTHRYTPTEARQMLDKTTYPEYIKTAVVSIYEGKSKLPQETKFKRPHQLSISYPHGGHLVFDIPEGGGNSNYIFFIEAGLTVDSVEVMSRTSPIGYAAVIHAAMKLNSKTLVLNSLWRCIYGSVLHREGRAVDVGRIDKNAFIKDPSLYKPQEDEWTKHKAQEKQAGKRLDDTVTEFGQIKALGTIRLKESQGKPLSDEEKTNKDKWSQVEEKLLGASTIRAFRLALQADPNVESLFDPWLMDKVVGDSDAGDPNHNVTSLEQLHHHHLHVTVRKIHV
jgi:hypothetical protein